MSTYYVVAPDEVMAIAESVIREHHNTLNKAGLTIGYLFAHADKDEEGNPKGPSIQHNGYAVAAVVRIVNLRDRVAGLPDVMIVIDGDQWPEWSAERRRAILDHELTHIRLTDKTDDADRPKVKLRKHDIMIGGFYEVIERHKEAAVELELLSEAGKQIRERNIVQKDLWG